LGESKFDSWWKQTYIATELWNTRLLSPGTGRLKNKQTNKQEDILQLGSLWRLAQNPAGYNEMAAI
jgi:hypothetical protein